MTGFAEGSPNTVSGSALRTPLGRPVVPDEYSISRPSVSGIGSVGAPASTSS